MERPNLLFNINSPRINQLIGNIKLKKHQLAGIYQMSRAENVNFIHKIV